MAVKTMMTELKWFLKGDTNIKYLVDNNCNVWNGDAYKKYKDNTSEEYGNDPDTLEEFIDRIKTDEHFAEVWGELGPIYGKQWRGWRGIDTSEMRTTTYNIDQIANLIKELKTNPDSRRLMVSAWNVGELSEMTLPPCHYGFQVYTRLTTREEKIVNPGKYRAISLMWNQRSVDTFLGLPFNIASYAALLCLIAEEVGMIPDQLIGNLGDVHLYKNHEDQAREQLTREVYDLPTVEFSNVNLLDGDFDFEVKDYKYHPSIKAPLSN
jgi:thymidylate synthase